METQRITEKKECRLCLKRSLCSLTKRINRRSYLTYEDLLGGERQQIFDKDLTEVELFHAWDQAY